MAYASGGSGSHSRSHSSGSSFSLIDGICVRIHSHFLPPNKVTLPVDYELRNSSDVLFMDEYDFSLEERVVSWMESQREKAASAAANASQEEYAGDDGSQILTKRGLENGTVDESTSHHQTCDENSIATDAIANNNGSHSDGDTKSAPADDGRHRAKPSVLQKVSFFDGIGNTVLKPTPFPATTAAHYSGGIAAFLTFNPAEFESEQDPFENLTLKTLDDMEELRQVLASRTPPVTGAYSSNAWGCGKGGVSADKSSAAVGCVSSSRVSQPPGSSPGSVRAAHVSAGEVAVCAVPAVGIGRSIKDVEYPSLDFATDAKVLSTTTTSLVKSADSNDNNKMTAPGGSQSQQPMRHNKVLVPPMPLPKLTSMATGNELKWHSGTCEPNSGSVKIDNTSAQGTTETPDPVLDGRLGGMQKKLAPPLPPPPALNPQARSLTLPHGSAQNCVKPTPAPRPAKAVIMRRVASNSTTSSTSEWNSKSRDTELTDPYGELAPEQQALVDRLTDMGFPQSRVARAAQKMGQDEKMIIDHLCAVDRIVEKGYRGNAAETSLYLFQEEDKALQFLLLSDQFGQLGFAEVKIKEALVMFDLDSDKALDWLTET